MNKTSSGGPLPGAFLIWIGFGVFQMVYVVPAVIIALKKGRRPMALGMGIAAGVTVLINGVVWVMLFGGGGHLVP